jgi:hypothetical protein
MTASTQLLATLVGIMVIFTAISPVILLWLLARDWIRGHLW